MKTTIEKKQAAIIKVLREAARQINSDYVQVSDFCLDEHGCCRVGDYLESIFQHINLEILQK